MKNSEALKIGKRDFGFSSYSFKYPQIYCLQLWKSINQSIRNYLIQVSSLEGILKYCHLSKFLFFKIVLEFKILTSSKPFSTFPTHIFAFVVPCAPLSPDGEEQRLSLCDFLFCLLAFHWPKSAQSDISCHSPPALWEGFLAYLIAFVIIPSLSITFLFERTPQNCFYNMI